MDEQLKDAFANHYKSKSLSAEQIERLNALTETDNPAPRYTRKALMGACAMVILLTALFFQPFVQPSKDITSMIAAEVAKNHIKMRPMEIKSQSMEAIQQYFTELDFVPMESQRFSLPNSNLIGGRYCSIQGVMAAQLRYKDTNNQWVTLYETQYDQTVFPHLPHTEKGEPPLKAYHSGLEIEIWVEKGLLMVSAQPGSYSL